MTRQLTLAEAQQRQAALDPWTEERKRHPGLPLMRVIYLDQDRQAFHLLQPTPLRKDESFLMDGATVITPSVPGGRDSKAFDAIVREWDDVWRAQQ